MIYEIRYTNEAQLGLYRLAKSEPKSYKKATAFIEELKTHPKEGTGHPEPLKAGNSITWSRRISKKHRLVYEIHEKQVVVLVLATYGHYEDK